MENDDKQLVENFLAGDESAFKELLKKYLKPIYNFLYQIVQDKSVVDDLTQETFIKVWKNLRRFNPKKNFKTWVFTIAKNTAYDYFKKKKTIPFSFFKNEKGDNKLENVPDENILPDALLEQKYFSEKFEEKLKEISEHYRMILNLHYKEDFSLMEISKILHKPYNTIKSSHKRALESLKKSIMRPN